MMDYKAGYIVTHESPNGMVRDVEVTDTFQYDMSNGKSGFEGFDVQTRESTWGYDDQITLVWPPYEGDNESNRLPYGIKKEEVYSKYLLNKNRRINSKIVALRAEIEELKQGNGSDLIAPSHLASKCLSLEEEIKDLRDVKKTVINTWIKLNPPLLG